jgi:ribosome maturation factor RimP
MSPADKQLEAVRAAVEPAVVALGLELYDVELLGGGAPRTLRITATRPGGVDLEAITAVTRALSPILDGVAIGGPYLLEVSSPGIERVLRLPAHYRGALGEQVSIKFHTDTGPRRERGVLAELDDEHAIVETDDGRRERIAFASVTQARTVFEWGPQPRPKASAGGKTRARAKGRS